MALVEIDYKETMAETAERLAAGGLLLTSQKEGGKANTMAIGWGTIGNIWARPVFIVLVRPSRFTFGLIESSGEFTVNVPTEEMNDTVMYCGSVSGRDHDKFAEKNLTPVPGESVSCPIIEECAINYECKVIHSNDLVNANLHPDIVGSAYPKGDFHRVYFGQILRVTRGG